MEEFKNQVAIITGAASGIGLAIAKKLVQSGAFTILMDIDKKTLQREFEGVGERTKLVSIDLTQEVRVDEQVKRVAAEFKKIDVLINCAGITGITNQKSHEVSSEDLYKVFDLNFMGSFFTSKAVIPFMLKNDYGRILHLASISGKEGNAGMLAYSISKSAVIGMAKVQGKEYAETGITVNALAPAVIRTPLVEAMPDEQVKYMTDKIPMKRCGTLKEVAEMALFIVSSKNSFTTGFTYDLSGGRATY